MLLGVCCFFERERVERKERKEKRKTSRPAVRSLQNGALVLLLGWLGSGCTAITCLANHTNDIVERTLNIDTSLGRRLGKVASQHLRHLESFVARDLTVSQAVAFVTDQHQRHILRILDSYDLVAESLYPLEG